MESYEGLLAAMPRIADAVNRFQSPEVQRRAFEALIAAFGADRSAPLPHHPEPADVPEAVAPRPLGTMARPPEPEGWPEPERDPVADRSAPSPYPSA